MLQQHFQNLKVPVAQPHFALWAGEAEAAAVQRQVTKPNHTTLQLGLAAGHGPDPGQQLLRGKGLCQIVICPAVQPGYPVVYFGLGCQQQHRQGQSLIAHLFQRRQTGLFRHHNIQHSPVIVAAQQIIHRVLPVTPHFPGPDPWAPA